MRVYLSKFMAGAWAHERQMRPLIKRRLVSYMDPGREQVLGLYGVPIAEARRVRPPTHKEGKP